MSTKAGAKIFKTKCSQCHTVEKVCSLAVARCSAFSSLERFLSPFSCLSDCCCSEGTRFLLLFRPAGAEGVSHTRPRVCTCVVPGVLGDTRGRYAFLLRCGVLLLSLTNKTIVLGRLSQKLLVLYVEGPRWPWLTHPLSPPKEHKQHNTDVRIHNRGH